MDFWGLGVDVTFHPWVTGHFLPHIVSKSSRYPVGLLCPGVRVGVGNGAWGELNDNHSSHDFIVGILPFPFLYHIQESQNSITKYIFINISGLLIYSCTQ